MWLMFLCCFFSLTQTGWSANVYQSYRQPQETKYHAQRYASRSQQQYQQKTVSSIIYEKEYFFFAAPEEPEEVADVTEAFSNKFPSVKKRQQVIFIKTPMTDAYERALEHLIQNTIQQKTYIYVFGKEFDYAGLEQKFHKIWNNFQNKPEVYFINYHNALDAQRIRSSIIDKYEDGNESFLATENTPVHKNYAMNYLPKDVDVVPGSSYIPLVVV